MKKIIFIFLLAVGSGANAQMMSEGKPRDISDLGGRPVRFGTGDYAVDGNVFYLPEYKRASIVFEGAKPVSDINIKLNLVSNEVIYMNEKNVEMAVATPVKEISFTDNGAKFRTGYPAVKDLGTATFYQVLAEGKAVLLKHYDVSYWETRPFNSAVTTRNYQQKAVYYAFAGNRMILLEKGNVNAFLEATGADKAKLASFISSNGLRFKNEDDYIKLLNFYNQG